MFVESDSMEVVDVVINPFDYRGTGAVVIDNCRELLMTLGKVTDLIKTSLHACARFTISPHQ
jgi:hypothetical protein